MFGNITKKPNVYKQNLPPLWRLINHPILLGLTESGKKAKFLMSLQYEKRHLHS